MDPRTELFTAAPPDARTIVITSEQAPAAQRAAVAEHADVIVAGTDGVDLKAALAGLAARGYQRVLTEGGPHLLAELAAGGLLDELCLTISPLLGGPGPGRILDGAASLPGGLPVTLGHVLEDAGFLLCRYRCRPGAERLGRLPAELSAHAASAGNEGRAAQPVALGSRPRSKPAATAAARSLTPSFA